MATRRFAMLTGFFPWNSSSKGFRNVFWITITDKTAKKQFHFLFSIFEVKLPWWKTCEGVKWKWRKSVLHKWHTWDHTFTPTSRVTSVCNYHLTSSVQWWKWKWRFSSLLTYFNISDCRVLKILSIRPLKPWGNYGHFRECF